jgi:signal transduction histidine kinase
MSPIPKDEIEAQEAITLIFASGERDASIMAGFMDRFNRPWRIVDSVPELCRQIQLGSAAAIVSEEALRGAAAGQLKAVIDRQPSWSQFPLLLLVSGEPESEDSRPPRLPFKNVVLLERTLCRETFLSTLDIALRDRGRQFQLRDQIREVERTREALRRSEKLAVAGRFAAVIAHEINNPLEAVTNLLYLIRAEGCSPQVAKYLDDADHELARATEITRHTLRFHREPTQPAQVDLAKVLDSVLALYRSRLMAARVTVFRQVPAFPVVVRAAVGELRQIVANIVGNALDAMRTGGRLRLRLSVETNPREPPWQRTRLTIADDGTGIPVTLLSTIFEPFITTKGETGTGLGLWITDALVKKNGWSIQVRSTTSPQRHGTTFSLLLPLPAKLDLVHSESSADKDRLEPLDPSPPSVRGDSAA